MFSSPLAALDVGLVAPEASGAGLDCVAAMHARKQDRYLPHQAELERANVQYVPMVWSAFGRPHAQTSTSICQLAKKVARRRGLLNASLFGATLTLKSVLKYGDVPPTWSWRASCELPTRSFKARTIRSTWARPSPPTGLQRERHL